MISVKTGHLDWLTINFKLNDKNSVFSFEPDIKEPLKNLNFNEAADYTANLISKKYDNIHISLSGGLDSEFVIKVFLKNKLKFTPVILVNSANEYESWYAFKFCKDNNLKLKILDFRGYKKHQELLKKIMIKSVKLNTKPNVSLIPNIISDMLDAPILTGYGDCYSILNANYIDKAYEEIPNSVEITEHDFYILLENKNHPAPFFCYTPEILVSSITDIDVKNSLQISKSKLYGLEPRPKINSVLHDVFTPKSFKIFFLERNKDNSAHINFNKNIFLNLINNK